MLCLLNLHRTCFFSCYNIIVRLAIPIQYYKIIRQKQLQKTVFFRR